MPTHGAGFRAALGLCLLAAALAGDAPAQSTPRAPRQKREFGSSLKRLRWDERKKSAVETRRGGADEKGAEAEEEEVVRVETALVVSDVLVLDRRGRAVRGLTREDFVVSEDGRPQAVGVFATGDGAAVPRSIVLIIDYSYAQLGFLGSSVEAAKSLVDALGPQDRMAIVTDEVKLLADFTRDKAELKKGLDSLTKKPASREELFRHPFKRGAHYSALLATLRELFDGADLRPIVILQAHGNEESLLQDSGVFDVPPELPPGEQEEARKFLLKQREHLRPHLRQFSMADIYAAAERSRATIYSVIPVHRLIGLSPDEQVERIKDWDERARDEAGGAAPPRAGSKSHWQLVWDARGVARQQQAMVELSKLTGGWADFIEEPTQAAAVYSRILSDVNRRYVIGYYPTNRERDGRRREVKIEVRGHPEYTVWGRNSYYAPGP